MRLWILRHAQSEGQLNVSAYKSLGDKNIPITDWGHTQAEAAGAFLADIAAREGINGFDIYHSRCRRANETAQDIARGLRDFVIPRMQMDARLDKQNFGEFDGLFTDTERQAKTPFGFSAYAKELTERGFYDARPPGGESIADVDQRGGHFIERFKRTGDDLIVVTHGLNALCLERDLLGLPKNWVLRHNDTMENCRITLIEGDARQGFRSEIVYRGLKQPPHQMPLRPGTAHSAQPVPEISTASM